MGAAGRGGDAVERWPRGGACSRHWSTYPFRPAETIAQPVQTGGAVQRMGGAGRAAGGSSRSPASTRTRGSALRSADPGDSRFALPFPGYESSFRTLSVHVRPERAADRATPPPTPRVLMRAIRAGHVYTAVDGVASPPSFEFTATNAARHGAARATNSAPAGR